MLPGGGRGSQGNIDGSDGSRGDGSDSGRGGGSDASHGGGHAGRRGVSTGGGRGGGRVGVGRGGSDASHGGGHAGGRGVSIGGGRGGGRVGVGRGGFGGGRGNGVGNGGGRGAIGEGGVEGVGRGGLGGVHRGGFGGGRGNGFVNGRGRGAIGEDGVEGVGRGGFGGIHHGGLGGGRGNGVVNGGGRGGIGVDGGPQGGVQGVGRGGFVGGGRGHGRGIIPHHRSIDALTESEARRLMPVLNPNRENGALWFEFDNAPRRVIVAAIRRHFDGPWFNMSSVPNETIIQWWGEFIQAFWWDQEHVALVYSYWYSITAARLRDMISKVRKGLERPYWISLVTWDAMSSYWNTTEAKEKSRIAAANRMSNRDGFGRHAHTSGARSYNQVRELIRQRDGIEPSMLQLLRETHRRVDGTYVDGRAQSIDEEINRQVRTTALGSETQSLDGTGATGLSQHEEDELYFKVVTPTQGGRVYGLGGQHAIRERGESSSMGASRLTLERQVNAMQEQLTSVVNLMKQFMEQNAETNRSSSPRTTPTSGRVNANDLESSLEAETRVVNGVSNRSTPKEHEANEEDDSIEEDDEEGNDDYAAY